MMDKRDHLHRALFRDFCRLSTSRLKLNVLFSLMTVRSPVRISSQAVIVAIFCEVRKTKASRLLLVVGTDQTLAVADAVPDGASASSRLHAAAGLEARDHVGTDGVVAALLGDHLAAVGISS